MKRAFVGLLLCYAFATAHAQAADAVSLAAQQEAEERHKNLVARIDEMQAAQLALEKRISAIAADFSKLRDEVARNNTSEATKESIRKLNDQILKVDESRVADNRRVQEGFEKLEKLIRGVASTPVRPQRDTTSTSSSGASAPIRQHTSNQPPVQDGFEYVIVSGDHLGKIVSRFREEKIMVTSKMIQDANPGVEWNKLKVGQKIFIPKPK